MSTEDPLEAQIQPLSGGPDSSKQSKKKKKKRKKKGKKKGDKRNNPKSYGNGPRFSRRESTPHHATVQSLASINQPIIVNKLTKMSQDLKYHRELQKALMELKQKDEDYRYAIEIGESLTKENQYLKEQIEILESQLHHQETDNTILKEKLETLSSTYHQELYEKHQDLQAHKELVNELQNTLQNKQDEITRQKQLNHQHHKQQQQQHINDGMNYKQYQHKDISNLKSSDFTSSLEKQLFVNLEKEKKKHLEDQQTIENLMKKLDDMMDLKKKYDGLKKANNELKQITKDELAQHIQMQKSIEAEAIYLAARKANLEEEREDLLNLIDQRDYEITMLNQQLTLQRKQRSTDIRQIQTLGDDIDDDDSGSNDDDDDDGSEQDGYYQHYDDEMDENDESQQLQQKKIQTPLSDEDEIDLIAGILDDEDIFDQELYDDDDDDDDDKNDIPHQQIQQQQQSGHKRPERKENEDESKDSKVFDKIKEYLHLSASAVKIKYPTVRNIQSDELIKRVKELPFYKYHDQMIRIMESEIKKISAAEKLSANKGKQEVHELDDGPAPMMQKRKSFLSIFNIFGDKSSGDKSDDDQVSNASDDNKSDGGISDNEQNDGGISSNNRRQRRHSKSRKKKRSYKKRKHRRSLSKNKSDDDNDNDVADKSDNEQLGVSRYPRGGVQASHQRLKKT